VTQRIDEQRGHRAVAGQLAPQQCMEIVQQAALQAGLQIQAQPDGGLRVFGTNNAVNVTQASISVSQF
jgi:hypothetical protein